MKTLAALLALTAVYAQMDHDNCPMKAQAKVVQMAKALSADSIDAYQKGTGMGMAMPAELNGYPGPRHILDLADRLHLTADQRTRIQSIYDSMHSQAVPLGSQILDLEGKLDHGFADSSMTAAELQSLTSDIATRQGRLRYVHLSAHIAAKDVLNREQIAEYMKLRHH